MVMYKIILSFGTLGQGGAAQVCANLSYPLCDKFDSVILITWADWPQFNEFDTRARWYCVEKEVGGTNEFKRMKWFREFVIRENPDMILSFLEPWNLRVLVSTIGLGVKTVVAERNEPHSVNKYWIMDQVEKFVYRLSDGILVQTPTIKKFFDGTLGNRTSIIYNPVNIKDEMVGRALETPKSKRVVSVARLMPQKNHDILIKAFTKFSTTHPDYTLTIYGDGPLMDELNKLAKEQNIADKVFIPGPSKTIHQDILDADMMCLVSVREGMSNSMIEAMCLGLPCICTKVSGAVDLIEDGKNGMLVDIGEIDELAEKMNLIADHHDLADEIVKNAVKLYDILNKEKIYNEWMNYIYSCLVK